MSTARRLLLLAAILPGFGVYLAISCSAPSLARQRSEDVLSTAGATQRLREGTSVDMVGTFSATGDRIMFYTSADKSRFGALENLNLERVARVVSDSTEPLEWNVSGTITEYQGANYLLISRAVLKSKPQRRGSAAAATRKPTATSETSE